MLSVATPLTFHIALTVDYLMPEQSCNIQYFNAYPGLQASLFNVETNAEPESKLKHEPTHYQPPVPSEMEQQYDTG